MYIYIYAYTLVYMYNCMSCTLAADLTVLRDARACTSYIYIYIHTYTGICMCIHIMIGMQCSTYSCIYPKSPTQ